MIIKQIISNSYTQGVTLIEAGCQPKNVTKVPGTYGSLVGWHPMAS